MTIKTDVTKLKCVRCGHEWYPRLPEIRICPKCKSAFWDRERKQKNTLEGKSSAPRRREKGESMNIGEEIKRGVVVPNFEPVPWRREEPEKTPEREPEKIPVKKDE